MALEISKDNCKTLKKIVHTRWCEGIVASLSSILDNYVPLTPLVMELCKKHRSKHWLTVCFFLVKFFFCCITSHFPAGSSYLVYNRIFRGLGWFDWHRALYPTGWEGAARAYCVLHHEGWVAWPIGGPLEPACWSRSYFFSHSCTIHHWRPDQHHQVRWHCSCSVSEGGCLCGPVWHSVGNIGPNEGPFCEQRNFECIDLAWCLPVASWSCPR